MKKCDEKATNSFSSIIKMSKPAILSPYLNSFYKMATILIIRLVTIFTSQLASFFPFISIPVSFQSQAKFLNEAVLYELHLPNVKYV